MHLLNRPALLLISATLISLATNAQWNAFTNQNTKVSAAANDQQDERVASDGHGGAIVVWEDFRDDAVNSGIYVQRMNANGVAKWTADGKVICNTATVNHSAPAIVEDGQGGAILVWQDWRNGDKDIYAQRVDSNGNALWTACGVPVVVNVNDQIDPRIISDGANGAIISWQDSSGTDWDVFAQHLSSSGNAMWAANGVPVCISAADQTSPKISMDGANGAFITWQDKRNGVDYDIYAQHLSSGGSALWANNGVVVCNSATTQNNPKIKSDGSSGAYVAWVDKRNGTDDIYAQRLNSSGAATWTANGTPVCIATGTQKDFDLVVNMVDGIIISWADKRNSLDYDIYAQRINPTGSPQWLADGIAVTTANNDQNNLDMTDDNAGGVIISWVDSSAGNLDIYSQHVTSAGYGVWGANGQVIANANDNQTRVKTTGDGNGGVVLVFQDKRSGTFDLYASHVTAAGIRSAMEDASLHSAQLKTYPQPASHEVHVMMERINGNSLYQIYNALGQNVSDAFGIQLDDKGILVNNMQLNTGIFQLVIQDGENRITQRLLFVK